MSSYVYKYVYKGEIIYIGKCDRNLKKRLSEHGKKGDNICESAWEELNNSEIYYAKCINRIMSDVIESELIRRYEPKWNIEKKKSDWGGIPFAEPKWILYTRNIYGDEVKKLETKVLNQKQENDLLQETIRALKTEIATYKILLEKKCNCCKYKQYKDVPEGFFDKKVVYMTKGCSYRDVIDEYRKGISVAYMSVSYSESHQIECIKRIYTSKSGNLHVEFIHNNLKVYEKSILYDPMGKLTVSDRAELQRWENRGSMAYFPYDYFINKDNVKKTKQLLGIQRAKELGKYTGRKAMEKDEILWQQLLERYLKREINKTQFAKELNVSRPTLDKWLKEDRKENIVNV